MKKIQSIYSVFLIVFMVILVSLPLYWVSNKTMKTIIFHLYLIPVIFCAFRFGLKGAVLVTIVSTLIYAPDYMLFWGTLSDDMIEAYARISIFTLVALLFHNVLKGRAILIAPTTNLVNEHYKLYQKVTGKKDVIKIIGNIPEKRDFGIIILMG